MISPVVIYVIRAIVTASIMCGISYLVGWKLKNLYNKCSYKLIDTNPDWIKRTIWTTYYGFSDIRICICEPTHPFVVFPYMYVAKEGYVICISDNFSFDNWDVLAHMALRFKMEKKWKLFPPRDMTSSSMATIMYLLEGNSINWIGKKEIIKEEDIDYGDTDNKKE